VRIVPIANINLDNLRYNYSTIRRKTGDAKIFAVVKADAYGHGLMPISRSLEKMGIDGFCAAVISEIEKLIQAGISKPILHLGRLHKEVLELNYHTNIWYTVNAVDDIPLLKWATNRSSDPIVVHLKIDTGMGRMGVPMRDAPEIAHTLSQMSGVHLKGLWSHLATSDESDSQYFYQQLKRFSDTLKTIMSRIDGITHLHIANSAAMLRYPESHFTMVRPGLALYGASLIQDNETVLRPVMSLNAPVTLIKYMKTGDSIGYNRTEILRRDKTIAIVQAGYADGIPIEASNRGYARWKNELYPIIGKISMDMLVLDVTDSDITPGQIVNLWGSDDPRMRVESIASALGKLPYELLTSISDRVEKQYTGTPV